MIRWMIPVLLLGACTTAPAQTADVAKAPSPPMVSFFTVAHEDDWQLFMMPDAFRALDEPQEKAVFIHLTAGDAGKGVTGEPVPYYLAREEGALRAVRFIVNAHAERGAEGEPGLGAAMTASDPVVAGHKVHRVNYRNAVVYFLRLADGYGEGTGYATTGYESLQRLVEGRIATMTAVDKSTSYQGWDDLQAALRGIIARERVSGSELTIRITEPDAALNQIEHSDHRHTAMTMLKVAEAYPCAAVLRYETYNNRNKPQNLTGADLLMHGGIWGATTSGLGDNYAPSTWEPGHFGWLGRMYVRKTPAKGACSAG